MGSVHSVKCFTKVEKGGKVFSDDEFETDMRKLINFCTAGLDALVKRRDKCSNVVRGHGEKYVDVLSTCFRFYIHLWPIY
jgi:hypothetical protein